MTILESLMVSIFGMSVVFLVLILLSFLVSLQSRVLSALAKKKSEDKLDTVNNTISQNVPVVAVEELSAGELKLHGVDEKTAAMIMAIVSDESGTPLSELRFKSIKLCKS